MVDKSWQPEFLTEAVGGSRRYRYVPFYELSEYNQKRVSGYYPHRSVGAKYNFVPEHYFYPINKQGNIASGPGSNRSLAIPYALIQDEEYMASLGYKKAAGW